MQAWPVHQTRPIRVLDSASGSMGSQDVSSRAWSHDSQKLRDWTQDEPVEVLQAGSMAEEEQPAKPLFTKPIADSTQAVSLLIQQIAD